MTDALQEFCDFHWPCSYSKPKPRKGNQEYRCINISSAHQKGHQDKAGNIFAEGLYRSTFNPDSFGKTWTTKVAEHLDEFQEELTQLIKNGDPGTSDLRHIQRSHSHHIERFFELVPSPQRFRSHSTCLCCLMQVPSHPLPCGHVLCTDCIKMYGRNKQNRAVWEMMYCPLHRSETEGKWTKPWVIKFKPDFAGVRLLSLDGYVLLNFRDCMQAG